MYLDITFDDLDDASLRQAEPNEFHILLARRHTTWLPDDCECRFPQMEAPAAPGSYQLFCAAYTPVDGYYTNVALPFNVNNYSPPLVSPPPPKTPAPTKAPTRKPTPHLTKPKTCVAMLRHVLLIVQTVSIVCTALAIPLCDISR